MFAVGTLFAVFGFLLGRAAAVCPRDVLLFLGFGFHFSLVGVVAIATASERDAVLKNALKIVFARHIVR